MPLFAQSHLHVADYIILGGYFLLALDRGVDHGVDRQQPQGGQNHENDDRCCLESLIAHQRTHLLIAHLE